MITRRTFLERSAAASVGVALTPATLLALEDDPLASERRPTLVVVFLRGGMDGLNLVVPHAEEAYHAMRPGIAVPRPGQGGGALDLDGRFGLHPAASALLPLFQEGTAVAVHAIGHAHNTRSHFEEQDLWETAVEEHELSTDGWLNRHLATSRGRGPVRALALGGGLPRSLRGEAQALALRGLSDLTMPGDGAEGVARTLEALGRAYGGGMESAEDARTMEAGARGLLAQGGEASLDALRHLQEVAAQASESKVTYPNTDLGRRCRELARLVRADVGLEVAELDLGGWDTHQNQGGAEGAFADRVRELSGALAALARDLEERLDDVLVVTVTEFGRTARQNGTNGTDHGWGSVSLALGGPVRAAGGGKARNVLGAWPGLEREQLNQGRDLKHTTDFRDVYAELLGFLGNERIGEVLPGHEPQPVGLV